MNRKKKSRPLVAQETGQDRRQGAAANPCSDCTTGKSPVQARIFSLLLPGEEHAIPAAHLATLAGFKDTRSLRAAIDRERELGFFILASDAGYFKPDSGQRGLLELRRFVRRTDARAASNRRSTAKIRAALRAAERRPLDGQEVLF